MKNLSTVAIAFLMAFGFFACETESPEVGSDVGIEREQEGVFEEEGVLEEEEGILGEEEGVLGGEEEEVEVMD